MCIICDSYADEKLSGEEALSNVQSMIDVIGEEHGKEVKSLVLNRELAAIMKDFDIKTGNLWPTASVAKA